MFRRTMIAAVVVMFFLAPNVRAAVVGVIPGITAAADRGPAAGFSLANLVNGSGLPGGVPALDVPHAWNDNTNAWQSAPTVNVYFDLHGSYDVAAACIWQWNYGPASAKDVQLAYSPNGTNYYAIPGITQLPNLGNYATQMPVRYDFTPVEATHMRLTIYSNWGYRSPSGFAYTGMNEVQFGGVMVPEPTAGALLALGALGAARRPRRAAG